MVEQLIQEINRLESQIAAAQVRLQQLKETEARKRSLVRRCKHYKKQW